MRSVSTEGLDHRPWFDDYAEERHMQPGDLLHWALNGPRRVANDATMSVSLTTEHWTSSVRRSYAMNYGNGLLRSVLGWQPRSRSTSGVAFWAKAAMTAAWRASGMQRRQSYQWVPTCRIDPDAPDGVRPLSAAETSAGAS